MFDRRTLREAEELASADDQMMAERAAGDDVSPGLRRREIIASMEEQRRARERRQDMLLVERLVDEFPETFEYLREGAASHLRRVSKTVLMRGGVNTLAAAERLVVRLLAGAVDEVYRNRMDRVAGMSRLGRQREQKGSDPYANPGVRSSFEPAPVATPEEAAANDVFDRLSQGVGSVFRKPLVWLLRRMDEDSSR